MTVQARITKSKRAAVEAESLRPTTAAPSETKAISDELLDEIDALLETNAAEFVAQYVQQGGE